jgi:hypothetical protein
MLELVFLNYIPKLIITKLDLTLVLTLALGGLATKVGVITIYQ